MSYFPLTREWKSTQLANMYGVGSPVKFQFRNLIAFDRHNDDAEQIEHNTEKTDIDNVNDQSLEGRRRGFLAMTKVRALDYKLISIIDKVKVLSQNTSYEGAEDREINADHTYHTPALGPIQDKQQILELGHHTSDDFSDLETQAIPEIAL